MLVVPISAIYVLRRNRGLQHRGGGWAYRNDEIPNRNHAYQIVNGHPE